MVAYTYPRYGYEVAVLKPRIDYLSFTFPIDEDEQEGLSSNIFHLKEEKNILYRIKDYHGKQAKNVSKKKVTKPDTDELKRYKQNFYIFPIKDSSKYALLQIDPTDKSLRYLRLRFNPNSLGVDGVSALWKYLTQEVLVSKFDWEKFTSHVNITRLDIAVDIIGAHVKELMIIDKRQKQAKTNTISSSSGRPETI